MQRLLFLLILIPAISNAQNDTVSSKLYQLWEAFVPSKEGDPLTIFEGKTRDFEWMKISLYGSKHIKTGPEKVPPNEENLLIVLSGSVTMTLKDTSIKIGKGSVALILPNDQYSLTNPDSYFIYYILKYRSKAPMDMERGLNAGGSFVINWNNLKFNPHDRGGVRNYFNKPTAMSSRFEMHVTTLNAGLKSHDPHTHRASEIVLIIEGSTEMQIGQSFYYNTVDGDLYFLGSNVLHGIKNIGTKPCMYFAFQFE